MTHYILSVCQNDGVGKTARYLERILMIWTRSDQLLVIKRIQTDTHYNYGLKFRIGTYLSVSTIAKTQQ